MNLFNLEKAFRLKEENNWEFVYIVIDLHDTMVYGRCHPKYVKGQFGFFKDALPVLRYLTNRKDVKLILYSSSSYSHIEEFRKFAFNHEVEFDFVNCNTDEDCKLKSDTADFTSKFYYNVILDDRGGFEGDTDWTLIKNYFLL
jgi:hypothetical protein